MTIFYSPNPPTAFTTTTPNYVTGDIYVSGGANPTIVQKSTGRLGAAIVNYASTPVKVPTTIPSAKLTLIGTGGGTQRFNLNQSANLSLFSIQGGAKFIDTSLPVPAPVYTFDITPALPAGLSATVNGATADIAVADASGVTYLYNTGNISIAGTPSVATPPTVYTLKIYPPNDRTAVPSIATFTLSVVDPNAVPLTVVTAVPTIAVNLGPGSNPSVSQTPISIVGGATPYTFSISPSLPAGVALNSGNGQISGTATTVSPRTVYTITVTDSSSPAQTQSGTFAMQVSAPSLSATASVSSLSLKVNQLFSGSSPVIGSGGVGTLSYAISPGLPAGMGFPSNGTLFGAPTAASPITTYTVTVSDSVGQTASATFTLVVDNLSKLVATQAVPSTVVNVNTNITKFLPIVGFGGVLPLTYSVAPSLPAGLSFNSAGEVTGQPRSVSANTTYTVTITDAAGQTDTNTFSLQVTGVTLVANTVISTKTLVRTVAYTPFAPVTATGRHLYLYYQSRSSNRYADFGVYRADIIYSYSDFFCSYLHCNYN